MGYIKVDSIIRGLIADTGRNTLHMYVPYLTWAVRGIKKWQEDGVYSDVKSTKLEVSSKKSVKMPDDFMMWNKVGVVVGNQVLTFINDQSLSLITADHEGAGDSLFGFPLANGGWDTKYDFTVYTNLYVSNDGALSVIGNSTRSFFKLNWETREIQMVSTLKPKKVYLEYVGRAFSPTSETTINEIAEELIKEYILYRESRFKLGAGHFETKAALGDYLDEQDEVRASLSDLSWTGILKAQDSAMTRRTISQ